LGRSIAIQLAQKGANVVIASRSAHKLEAAIADIKVGGFDDPGLYRK
jgi:3-dehydrosphinganine reductase